MITEPITLTSEKIRELFLQKPRRTVVPAPEGRFLLHVPALNDGKGPIYTPNVKDMNIRLTGGTTGEIDILRSESGTQAIQTDGTQVIVINKIDEHVGLALSSKYNAIVKKHGTLSREAIEEFLTYARGFSFDSETGKAHVATPRVGFNPDIYFQAVSAAKKLHCNPADPGLDLRKNEGPLVAGRYIKVPATTTGIFIDSPFTYRNQTFEHGAMIQISGPNEQDQRSVSFIDPTDINQCYTAIDGSPLVDTSGKILLPHYSINPNNEVTTMATTYSFTEQDVLPLEATKVKIDSSRVYIKPKAAIFSGADMATFINETDKVTQKLEAADGVIINAFNYSSANSDYTEKANKFRDAIEAAHAKANTIPELIAAIQGVYSDLQLGTPDIYTSTRAKMKLDGLEGVTKDVVLKTADAEVLRITAPSDTLQLLRESEHRDEAQTYAGDMFVQITDRGSKYQKVRGIHPNFAATAYKDLEGKPLDLNTVPTYEAAAIAVHPQGVAGGTAEVASSQPQKQVG